MQQNILFKTARWLIVLLATIHFGVSAQNLIWLKPIEADLKMDGNQIVEGSALDLMKFVASQIENINHDFHAYPVKRSWHLIQREKSSDTVYCFWGADYKKERTKWGVFTQPASISLPYMVATRKNELKKYVSDGEIRATDLLRDGYSTVVYDKVINPWTKIMDKIEQKLIVKVSGIDKDLSNHTLLLVDRKRIDFGYVSHRAIANLNLTEHPKFDLYEIHEMSQSIEKDSRMLCSKTPLGIRYSKLIDEALARIQINKLLSEKLRDLTFESEGYPEKLRVRFNKYWKTAFPN